MTPDDHRSNIREALSLGGDLGPWLLTHALETLYCDQVQMPQDSTLASLLARADQVLAHLVHRDPLDPQTARLAHALTAVRLEILDDPGGANQTATSYEARVRQAGSLPVALPASCPGLSRAFDEKDPPALWGLGVLYDEVGHGADPAELDAALVVVAGWLGEHGRLTKLCPGWAPVVALAPSLEHRVLAAGVADLDVARTHLATSSATLTPEQFASAMRAAWVVATRLRRQPAFARRAMWHATATTGNQWTERAWMDDVASRALLRRRFTSRGQAKFHLGPVHHDGRVDRLADVFLAHMLMADVTQREVGGSADR